MAYEVTATRKRPRSFDQIVGQEFVVATLRGAIERQQIAHAFLFSGPRGVGKTSAARVLARALNCATGPTASPCDTCNQCREITAGASLDVIEIDGASNTGVDDVRAIKDEVLFPPASARYKVYIIDEVHMLSTSAFNALLKTVEEPPPYVVFIFATTEIHKVPATIRSRCQQFTFRLFSTDEIRDRLVEVATELNLETDDEALIWIAKEADGSLRDAYTTFDQVASFAGERRISIDAIRDTIGALSMAELNRVGTLIGSDDAAAMLALADDILERGVSVERFVIALADYLRSLLLLRHGVTRPGILGYPEASFSADVRSRISVSQLELAGELLLEVHRNLKQSVSPRFELELLLSRLARVTGMITPDELLAEVQAIKGQFTGGGSDGGSGGDSGGAGGRGAAGDTPGRPPEATPGGPMPPTGGTAVSGTGAAAPAPAPPPRPAPRPNSAVPGGGRPKTAAPPLRDSERATGRDRAGHGAPAAPAADTAGGTAPSGAAAAPAAPDGAPELLHEIGARVRAQNQMSLAASVERAEEAVVTDDRLTMTFAAADRYHGGKVANAQQTVASAASEILGRPVSVGVDYRRDREPEGPPADASGPEHADVGRFCKIFRGEVVKEIAHGI